MKEQLSLHEIDTLTAEFNQAVSFVAFNPEKKGQMLSILQGVNPEYQPIGIKAKFSEAEVLAEVVAAVYAPLIHGFSSTVLENIQAGTIPSAIIAPIRDAIPIVVSLQTLSEFKSIPVTILTPPVNRITAGIPNNQKDYLAQKDPLFDLLMNQMSLSLDGVNGVTELETGIYGTTSLEMAKCLRENGIQTYVSLKFYGLGPNLSYVHAVLSGGQEWVAEKAETDRLVNSEQIAGLMVLLDTMEELGMQNFCQIVDKLQIDDKGLVQPVLVPTSPKQLAIACATNQAVRMTTEQYQDIDSNFIASLLRKIPVLVQLSNQGWPFTLKQPIPPMESKEEYFKKLRNCGLFTYPKLILK